MEVIEFTPPRADNLKRELARIERACAQGSYRNPLYSDSNTSPLASLLLSLTRVLM